jgi:hypothetical protein
VRRSAWGLFYVATVIRSNAAMMHSGLWSEFRLPAEKTVFLISRMFLQAIWHTGLSIRWTQEPETWGDKEVRAWSWPHVGLTVPNDYSFMWVDVHGNVLNILDWMLLCVCWTHSNGGAGGVLFASNRHVTVLTNLLFIARRSFVS